MDVVTFGALSMPCFLNAAAGELFFDAASEAIPRLFASAASIKEVRQMLDFIPVAFPLACGSFARPQFEGSRPKQAPCRESQ